MDTVLASKLLEKLSSVSGKIGVPCLLQLRSIVQVSVEFPFPFPLSRGGEPSCLGPCAFAHSVQAIMLGMRGIWFFSAQHLQHIRQHYADIYSDARSTMRLFMWHKDQKAVASCLLRLLSQYEFAPRLNAICVPSTVLALRGRN